ncbi:MAG: metallophosphoesterase family protein [Chthonomonadales bacterium]|nr:metallophosphoesterase family protein [Chthonomonadales bacterium]
MNVQRAPLKVAIAIAVTLGVASMMWAGAQNGAPAPTRVILCPTADTSTGASVTWRGPADVNDASAQIVEDDGSPKIEGSARSVPARAETLDLGSTKVKHFSVTFDGLKPDTTYAYRGANGKTWSEWFTLRTASRSAEPFTFLYFGDEQNGIRSHCSRVVRRALMEAPDARLMVHGGDLTTTASSDSEWGEWFDMAGYANGSILNLPAIGNHQYERTAPDADTRRLTGHWRAQFELPQNGVAGLEESCYYVDFQGVRFVVLNSMEKPVEQASWLDSVLTGNRSNWIVVVFHHPLFSGARNRDNAELRQLWKPILDRHRVDLVLQGHDHVYGRSNPDAGPAAGRTVYVVSVTGTKQYEAGDRKWAARFGQDLQLYQIIRVDKSRLNFEAHTADGALYDAFEIQKSGERVTFRQTAKPGPERLRSAK